MKAKFRSQIYGIDRLCEHDLKVDEYPHEHYDLPLRAGLHETDKSKLINHRKYNHQIGGSDKGGK